MSLWERHLAAIEKEADPETPSWLEATPTKWILVTH